MTNRHDRLLEKKLRQRLEKETSSQIRQSAELAAEHIWKTLQQQGNTARGNAIPEIPSFDMLSLASSVSAASSKERAMRRGSRRGSREMNEAEEILNDIGDLESEFTTTMTTTSLTETLGLDTTRSKKKKKSGIFKSRKKKGIEKKQKSSSRGDAWMCGVCGQAFATMAAADRHESKHIQQVVSDLGWGNKTNDSASEIFRQRRRSPRSAAGTNPNTAQRPIARSFSLEEWEKEESKFAEDGKRPVPSRQFIQENEIFAAEDGLPVGTLVPKPRSPLTPEVRFQSNVDPILGRLQEVDEDSSLLLSNALMNSVVLADEALISVCRRAETDILTPAEVQAERELALLADDKAYYDDMTARAVARQVRPTDRYRSDGEGFMDKVQNKLLDAYQIMKESDEGGARTGLTTTDQYNKKRRRRKEGEGTEPDDDISHTDGTLYVNVMVRNSVQVVKRELERLAGQRWEKADDTKEHLDRFERFRIYAHLNIVKLAGIALASDFTPRRIAVQLSNDLYRLLTPRLKRRGVAIASEIEYRVGPYFVLAVNITSIDWRRLIKATHRDAAIRKARWEKELKENADTDEAEDAKGVLSKWKGRLERVRDMPLNDILEQLFARMYFLHWVVYLPICYVVYYTVLGSSIRQFILSSVTDEIFFYAEEKGMEMEISTCVAAKQAAFMLSALREIRADGRALAKRRKESEQQEKGATLGPLLGPAVKMDSEAAVKPDGFEVPANLEFVSLELDLPVGFRRLRWALLSSASTFVTEAIYKDESKYEDITLGEWDNHDDFIGAPELPDGVESDDFVGATKEGSYLMPRSAFVAANMCFETHHIVAYNDYCFCLKKRARNPDVPFGKSFFAWTQYLVINLGNDSCRLFCSVEAEFPNGEPMVARQIRSGMRAGTGELFVLIGETISKYADEFP